MRLVFLDRDGVINRFPGKGYYVVTEEGLHILPNALKGIRLLTEAGFQIHVISNQGCVARGMITRTELKTLTEKMSQKIKRFGGKIHRVHYCLHQESDNCRCKKPKTFLLKKAHKGSKQPRKEIYFIGDSREDVQAGARFGCRTVLLLSGRSKKKDIRDFPVKPEFVKKNLLEAARWLTRKKS